MECVRVLCYVLESGLDRVLHLDLAQHVASTLLQYVVDGSASNISGFRYSHKEKKQISHLGRARGAFEK